MALQPYGLDRVAQELVTQHLGKEVLNESHKMRTTAAYGLERFWGEHLRYGDTNEGHYWKAVWDNLVTILNNAGISLPVGTIKILPKPPNEDNEAKEKREQCNAKAVQAVAAQLWEFAKEHPAEQRVALAVLIQLCDCLVWWTQRYKAVSS
jgi:hypothetical protein